LSFAVASLSAAVVSCSQKCCRCFQRFSLFGKKSTKQQNTQYKLVMPSSSEFDFQDIRLLQLRPWFKRFARPAGEARL
jgi:hypothetical protein